ncbi:putative sodium-dependent multivitamin transporter [Prorops nasuta]|uniref:putative sodium-dependent multivitamin transporter n=1 Tax=Prorops nasuta TaxID=863751 RepID=UPI0034CEE0C7
MQKQQTLQWPDYLVIGVVLAISGLIGLYYRFTGGRQKTVEEYFSANRSMNALPLAIALMVSFVSAITLLGISSENYVYGTQFAIFYLGAAIGTPLAMYLYLPVFFQLNTTSVYEYLERRFGVTTRLVTSVAIFVQLMLYTGVVLYAPSLALEATTGLSGTTSVLLIGLICTFYSTIGGIKAVLVTDVFQGFLMFASILTVLGIANEEIEGGLASVWRLANEGGRVNFFDFRLDPTVRHTWWGLLFGGACLFLSLYGVNQVQVQRLLTTKSLRSSQMALLLNLPFMLAFGLVTCYSGLALYAIYKDCDPTLSGSIDSPDKIMVFFVAERMSRLPGLPGLFVAGIFSASLSTISAMLNSLAAVALEDYVKPLCKIFRVEISDERRTLLGKGLAILNGVICLLLAFLAREMGSLVEVAMSISGAIGGPVLGVFSLGIFLENANEIGAVVGTITGLTLGLWATFGQPRPIDHGLPVSIDACNSTILSSTPAPTNQTQDYFYLYKISYVWYTPMGMQITMAIGILASFIASRVFRVKQRPLDPNLFTPCLAKRIRRRMENAEVIPSSQVFVLEADLKS